LRWLADQWLALLGREQRQWVQWACPLLVTAAACLLHCPCWLSP